MRSMARRFEQEAPDVSRSILEGLDEVLTVSRLGLPLELRRSLAGTNIIESMNSTVRQVCRNVKRWRNAGMALRQPAAGMTGPIRVSAASRRTGSCPFSNRLSSNIVERIGLTGSRKPRR